MINYCGNLVRCARKMQSTQTVNVKNCQRFAIRYALKIATKSEELK